MSQTVEISLTSNATNNDPATNSDFTVNLNREVKIEENDIITAQAYVSNGQSPGTQFVEITTNNNTGSFNIGFGSYVRMMVEGTGPIYDPNILFNLSDGDNWKYLFYTEANTELVHSTLTITITPGVYTVQALTDEINRQMNASTSHTGRTKQAPVDIWNATGVLNAFQALIYAPNTQPDAQYKRSAILYDGTNNFPVNYTYSTDNNRTDGNAFDSTQPPDVPYLVGSNAPTLEFNTSTNKYEFSNFHTPCHNPSDGTRSILITTTIGTTWVNYWPCSSFCAVRLYEPEAGGLWSVLGMQQYLNTPAQIADNAVNNTIASRCNFITTTSQFYSSVSDSASFLYSGTPRFWLSFAFTNDPSTSTTSYYFDFNSTKIISSNTPLFSNTPFYLILTDLLSPDESSYISTSTKDILPVIALCTAGYQTSGGYQLGLISPPTPARVKKTRVVNSIRIKILASNGTTPTLSPNTSVIFSIQRGF